MLAPLNACPDCQSILTESPKVQVLPGALLNKSPGTSTCSSPVFQTGNPHKHVERRTLSGGCLAETYPTVPFYWRPLTRRNRGCAHSAASESIWRSALAKRATRPPQGMLNVWKGTNPELNQAGVPCSLRIASFLRWV